MLLFKSSKIAGQANNGSTTNFTRATFAYKYPQLYFNEKLLDWDLFS